jgi:hypothetical protein
VVYATKIEFLIINCPLPLKPMMPFISKKELDILEAKDWSQNRMLMKGAKIESYSVHIRNDN